MSIHEPGQTWVGMLGGGQLGRMLTLEARRMGYSILSWAGGPDSGAAALADEVLTEPFDSEEALEKFLARADVATVEFENIPAPLLEAVAARIPMNPGPGAVKICQHREREKTFLAKHGFPCGDFYLIDSAAALAEALPKLPGSGGILKTAEFGYDGKGQLPVSPSGDAETIWEEFGTPRAVLEEKIDLAAELSVLIVRDQKGNCRSYDPAENQHRHHILDLTIVPARLPGKVLEQARKVAEGISEALEYAGMLAVEFFLAQDGRLLVNELAPRPHCTPTNPGRCAVRKR